MSEDQRTTPFGPGFIGSCIVVGALVICGLVLATNQRTGPAAAGADTVGAGAVPDGEGSSSGSFVEPSSDPDGAGRGQPARQEAGSCGLPGGDQHLPTTVPASDGWEVSRKVVVPRSAAFGPATTDPDGFRRCFAHSPTGAVYAAYNAMAALADLHRAIPTVKKLMVPGPDTDALLTELRAEPPSLNSETTQVAGFRVLDAGQDRATIMLAVPVESAYMSLTLTLVWHDGDWKVQPPPPGGPVGAPFSQVRDLADFVTWSGV